MPTPAYPSTISRPEVAGYGLEPADPIARTDMEYGPARARRRYTAFPDFVAVRWSFPVEELAVFEAWHRLTVLDGESWFDVELLNGLQVNTVSARFVGVPKKSAISNGWFYVSARLEVRDLPILTQEYLDAAIVYKATEITYCSPLLDQLMNHTVPVDYAGLAI